MKKLKRTIFSGILLLSMTSTKVKVKVPNIYENQEGFASYYADKFEECPTANGEIFRKHLMTAAHKSLPFGSWVKVTNLENHKEIYVRINDRGPFIKDRIIDLTEEAANRLDIIKHGTACVKLEYVDPITGCP